MKGLAGDFCTTGMEHSPTSTTGFRVEPTPWRAVQVPHGMRCAGLGIASRDSRSENHARTRWNDIRLSREPQDDESNEE